MGQMPTEQVLQQSKEALVKKLRGLTHLGISPTKIQQDLQAFELNESCMLKNNPDVQRGYLVAVPTPSVEIGHGQYVMQKLAEADNSDVHDRQVIYSTKEILEGLLQSTPRYDVLTAQLRIELGKEVVAMNTSRDGLERVLQIVKGSTIQIGDPLPILSVHKYLIDNGIGADELYKNTNMGIGFVYLIEDRRDAELARTFINEQSEYGTSQIIGSPYGRSDTKLVIHTKLHHKPIILK